MKLKELKKILDKMTPAELNQELLYNSKTHLISGAVLKVSKVKNDLLWDGSDDPSTLLTRSGWKKYGMDKEEIDEMDVEIPKGSIIIEF